jgi:NAD(P)-dependent dehydrogenase (short-subunit alcohol dehydrogenase family)
VDHPFSLAGETALITGGGTGLGFGIARCFARAGARVVIVGRREEVLKKAAQEIGNETVWESHDILKLNQASELLDRISRRVGPVTILVNNAGIHIKKSAVELTPEEFSSILQTHLVGAFSLTKATLPGMIERRHGSILFSASMASLIGLPLVCAYSAAKAGYLGMVRSLATEVSPSGVRVNAIAPGWIDSEMMRTALNGDPERKTKVLARTPMNRFGVPDDIGWAATYLCSPAARFVTGVVLPVDGGASIGF